MIRQINQDDFGLFCKAGVEFSTRYPLGIKKFLSAGINDHDREANFFFAQGGSMQCFIYEEGHKIRGRVAAMIHPELYAHKEKTGLLGLFDCDNDFDIARSLLDAAILYLKEKGCKTVWGPMDFSIWHQYRFMSSGFERHPFYGEPRNPEYYPAFFEQYGFETKTSWESQVLDMKGMELFYDHNRDQLELFYRLHYSFEKLSGHNSDRMMDVAYEIITKTYTQFPGFSYISLEQFKNHYKGLPRLLDKDCTLFVKNPDGAYVGFLLVFKDITTAVQAMNGKTGLLSKLRFKMHENKGRMANIAQGAALPYYIREAAVLGRKQLNQPLTLAGATICQAIKNIMDSGRYDQTIISLMRDGAQIRNHAHHETTETREYKLYQINIQ